jgi:hypothetical protein
MQALTDSQKTEAFDRVLDIIDDESLIEKANLPNAGE